MRPSTASRILAELGGFCERFFERLAQESPTELVEMVVNGSIPVAQITFAAEHLGAARPIPEGAVAALANLLHAQSPVQREGAIYGLRNAGTPEARAALEQAKANDRSELVRQIAADALSWLDEDRE